MSLNARLYRQPVIDRGTIIDIYCCSLSKDFNKLGEELCSSLEYFIKVINEHIWVIAGYPLMQFDVNGVQFRILTICKIIRSQFSEQVAAPRDWKHYVPIVYLIVYLQLLHNAHRNPDNQLGANNIITAPTPPLLWCYDQPRHGAGPRRAVIMWRLALGPVSQTCGECSVGSILSPSAEDELRPSRCPHLFPYSLQHSGSCCKPCNTLQDENNPDLAQEHRVYPAPAQSRWLVYL